MSCRHVLELVGADRARIQVRQAAASSPEAWVDCVIAWQHPTHDLVLLRITPLPGQSWDPPRAVSALARIGERPFECDAIGFPEVAARPGGLRDSDQVRGWLLPAGRARDPSGLVPFDVDSSHPDDALLWQGLSGAAVLHEQSRLVGLVAQAYPGRQQRRLLVVPIENAASDPDFAAAAGEVGLDPIVEDFRAPSWRTGVEPGALTETGAPATVADVKDLSVFGVYRSAAAVDARGLYLGYIERDKDPALDAALAGARGGGRRIVLLVGNSAAGKSRSASEALRRERVLRGWRLVVPMSDAGLSRLEEADLGWHETVIWLDDLDKYLSRGLDVSTLRRILGEDDDVIVVATMRTSQLQAHQGQLADPAWSFLTDDSEVSRVDLEAPLSDNELQTASADISDTALLRALREGVGLGEWLVAGPELVKKLNDERSMKRAFADTVISWYRTGLDQPIAREDAQRLWADALSPTLRQRLLNRGTNEQEELFEQAAAWACQPIISRDLLEQALVIKMDGRYAANDYVVDHTVRDPHHLAVPDSIWECALQAASSSAEPKRQRLTWSVGVAAYREKATTHALTAMRSLADAGNPGALFNVGVLLEGSPEAEIRVYDDVVAWYGKAPEPSVREQVAKALFNKGVVLDEQGPAGAGITVFDEVVTRYGEASEPALRELVAKALVNKGLGLGQQGYQQEAFESFDEVITRYREASEPALREWVAKAFLSAGSSLDEPEDAAQFYDELVTRYAEAPEAALRELVAQALVNKGIGLGQRGHAKDAVMTFDEVITRYGEAPEPALREQVAKALVNKGVALAELSGKGQAARIFDDVITRYGEAPEPALREQVATARSLRAEISPCA
jgi:tetratricopeptide (TPR) repeat protein